jgi:histidyl-tRNA synthetase
MKKQLTHAHKRAVPYVVMVGEQEMNSNTFTLKNMKNGQQEALTIDKLIQVLVH